MSVYSLLAAYVVKPSLNVFLKALDQPDLMDATLVSHVAVTITCRGNYCRIISCLVDHTFFLCQTLCNEHSFNGYFSILQTLYNERMKLAKRAERVSTRTLLNHSYNYVCDVSISCSLHWCYIADRRWKCMEMSKIYLEDFSVFLLYTEQS